MKLNLSPAVFALVLLILCGTLVQSHGSFRRLVLPASSNELVNLQSREQLNLPLINPRLLVSKSDRRLDLFSNGRLVRSYKIGLGFNPVGDKKQEGDGRTPEGDFYIFVKNPKSAYYLSLGISYPNIEDAERGLRDGLINKTQHDQIVSAIKKKGSPPQYTRLGGLIYIHGHGAKSDWTLGCVALENEDMKELYDAVPRGTPVKIQP